MKALLSVLLWIMIAMFTIAAFLSVLFATIFLFPFDKKRKFSHRQGFWWADAIVGLNPFWRFTIEGFEHIDPKKTYVIVANHQSLADIILLYKTRIQFKWVAKEGLFKIPIFGWAMSMVKYIRLCRDEYGSIKNVYKEAGDWLKQGISVFFFPEGTRSKTGQIGNFKNGAFKLAIQEKKPILPIYIEGTRDIIQKGGWIFNMRASCKMKVLPSIDTATLEPKDLSLLKNRVREQLLSGALKETFEKVS